MESLSETALRIYLCSSILVMIISALITITIANLLGFHLYLTLNKTTTYEYILKRRKKNSQVKKQDTLEEIYEPYLNNSRKHSQLPNEEEKY